MRAWPAASLTVALLGACSNLPAPGPAGTALKQMQQPDASLVLITVRNRAEPVPSRAASGLRGYDTPARYAVGEQAREDGLSLARQYRLQRVDEWPIAALAVNCLVLRATDERTAAQLVAALRSDPRVQLAQPLQRFATLASSYNDPYVGLQRGFAQIDAARAQQWSRGEGIRVAVIDTGMDTAHPDLAGRIESQRNFVDDNVPQFSSDRHGTEVAGVIAADANNHEGIVGVAPGVRILALKACWQLDARADGAQCNSFTIAKALAIAIDAGARIINLSLGGPHDPLLTQLTAYAMSRGVVIVGAVPPDGSMDGFPVGVPGVIAVDTVERARGAPGALRAPGRDVLTLTPGGHYDFVSGSSLAAAHVSGAVALLMATDRRLDAAAIYELLRRTSAPAEGAGRAINVCAALVAARAQGDCPVLSAAAPDPSALAPH